MKAQVRRIPFGAVDAVIAVIWVAVLFMALLPGGGRDLFVVATLATALTCVLWISDQRFPTLLLAFQLGFVTIVGVEGILNGDELIETHGVQPFARVARYVVAALAVFSLAHIAVFRGVVRPGASAPGTADGRPDGELSARTVRRTRHSIFALFALYAVGIWPRFTGRVSSGRLGAFTPWFNGTALEPLVSGMVNATGMVLPPLITFHIVRQLKGRPVVAVLGSLPVLAIQFAIGTRFPLLFSTSGIVVVLFAGRAIRPAAVIRGVVVAGLVFTVSAVMTQFRSVGLETASSSGLSISGDRIKEGEKTIENMIDIADWYDHNPGTGGATTLTATYFWVPRTFWPGKPEAMGYWFPRRYGDTESFSSGHSIAYSFAGDSYADFGFGGGLLVVAGLGVIMGLIDRWVARIVTRTTDIRLVIAAPLFGAAFFAARSIDTAAIASVWVLLLGSLIVRWTSGSRRVRKATDLVPPPSASGRPPGPGRPVSAGRR